MKSVVKLLFISIVFIGNSLQVVFAVPTDNPFRAKYTSTTPAWTDSLNWSAMVSISDFKQTTETEFDSALVRAFSNLGGMGGTVYFPAGTYNFSGDIVLPTNVILRGETPNQTDARLSDFAPPTRLIFPKYIPNFLSNGTPNSTAFKDFRNEGDVQNCGLIYLDINRGRISLGGSGSERILVFGIRQNNIAQPDAGVPDMTYMNGWERFSYRHTRNISVNAKRAAAVVCSRINDLQNNTINPIDDDTYSQPGYIVKGTFLPKKGADASTAEDFPGGVSSSGYTPMKYGDRIKFNYLDHYGIGISGAKMNPIVNPVPINQEILLLDNWVLTTMRVSYFIEGIGAIARGNVKRDIQGKMAWIHPAGKALNTNNSATFENRGLNFAGENIIIEDNDFEVIRHNFYSGYASVDGEGILIQWQDPWGFDTNNPLSGASTRMYDVTISNNKMNAYIGIYDITVPISNLHINNNDLQGKGNVLVFQKSPTYRIDNLYIEGNKNLTGIFVGYKVSTGVYAMKGSNIFIRNNTGVSGGNVYFPPQSIVENNTNFGTPSLYPDKSLIPIMESPYQGAYSVPFDAPIELTFRDNIEAVNLSNITMKAESEIISTPVTASISGNKLIITNPGLKKNREQYTISVPQGSIRIVGNSLQNDSIGWRFRAGNTFTYTGVENMLANSNLFYPNPATDKITINSIITEPLKVTLYSLDGIQICQKEIRKGNNVFPLNNLSKGVYLLMINNESNKLIIR